jgi:hypothetical protein
MPKIQRDGQGNNFRSEAWSAETIFFSYGVTVGHADDPDDQQYQPLR